MSEDNTDPNTDPNTNEPVAGAWRDSLPDDLKDSKCLLGHDSIEGLARSHVNVQPLIGSKLILPGKDTSDEDRNAFYTQLGRPETAEGYELPADGLPEGYKADPEKAKEFFEFAHKQGFTDQQAAGMVRYDALRTASIAKAANDARKVNADAVTEGMKKEWGPSYDEKMALAKGALSKFGGPELLAEIEDTGIGNNPALIKAMAEIGKAIAEDEILGSGKSRQFISSPAEAEAKIGALRGDKEFMERYTSKSLSIRKSAMAEMDALMAIQYPNTRKA